MSKAFSDDVIAKFLNISLANIIRPLTRYTLFGGSFGYGNRRSLTTVNVSAKTKRFCLPLCLVAPNTLAVRLTTDCSTSRRQILVC